MITIRNTKKFPAGTAILLFASLGAGAAPTVGNDDVAANSAQLDEIVVTAERREAKAQDTPIAMSAVTGATLEQKHITDLDQLAESIPNLEVSSLSSQPRVFIRGVGQDGLAPGADPRVAMYTDGVYNARVQSAFDSFFDVDRVEVLEGPQGTLYGRNATAGAINIISRDPGETLNGYGSVTYGNYGLVQTEGAVGGAITDSIAGRIAFQTINHGGYGIDIEDGAGIDDEDKGAVRGKLQFKPSDNVKILLEGDYSREDDHSGGKHFITNAPGSESVSESLGFEIPSNPRDIAQNLPRYVLHNYGAAATTLINIGQSSLTSIGAYRHLDSFNFTTVDATTSNYFPVTFIEDSNEVTQELRFAKSIGPVDSLIGIYFFHEDNTAVSIAPVSGAYFGLPPALLNGEYAGGTQKTDAYAAFTQETWHITARLGLDVGVRYSFEKRSVDQFFQFDLTRPPGPGLTPAIPTFLPGLATFANQSKSWDSVDPKVTLHYKLTDDVLAYATYSTGFKSGGFNLDAIQPAFQPERVKDYEGGIKADLLGRRLRVDLSGFHNKYTDLQVTFVDQTEEVTNNAAGAKVDGIEAQISALPIDPVRVDLNIAWLDSEYTSYESEDPGRPQLGILNLAGNPLKLAPRWKVSGDVGYTFKTRLGDIAPRAGLSWTDRISFSQFNVPYQSQGSYLLANFYVNYDPGNGWLLNAFVRNATDKLYVAAELQASAFIGNQIIGSLGDPRTYGVTLSKQF
jgi:iron complex outermembrane recepter protein